MVIVPAQVFGGFQNAGNGKILQNYKGVDIAQIETGLGVPRLQGERGRTYGQLRAFAALIREGSWQQASIDTAIPDRVPLPKLDIRSVLRPLGPVAVFSTS